MRPTWVWLELQLCIHRCHLKQNRRNCLAHCSGKEPQEMFRKSSPGIEMRGFFIIVSLREPWKILWQLKIVEFVMKSEVTSILSFFRWESPMGFSSLKHANFSRALATWPPPSWGAGGGYSLLDRLYSKVLPKKDTIFRLIVLYMKRKRLPNNSSLTKEMKRLISINLMAYQMVMIFSSSSPRKKVCLVSPIFQISPKPIWYPVGWLTALHVKKWKITGKISN